MGRDKFLGFFCCVSVFLVLMIYNKGALGPVASNAIYRIDVFRKILKNETSNFAPCSPMVEIKTSKSLEPSLTSWFYGDRVMIETSFYQDELRWALDKASMPDKTVIVTSVNAAWMEPNGIFDLFMKSFHDGEGTESMLRNLLVVAMDEKAYTQCAQVHRHCYRLITPGVDFSGEKTFMTQDYLKMTHSKILFLKNIIDRGYNFLFSDVDILWFRNPFQRFSNDSDIEMSSDRYHGNPYDMTTPQNTGFMFFRSNERTVNLLELWHSAALMRPGMHDQDVLTEIKMSSSFRDLGVKVRFLNTLYFSGFCQAPKNLNVVCTMHANCCKGLKAKVHDLKETLEDWVLFRSSRGRKGHWRRRSECMDSFST